MRKALKLETMLLGFTTLGMLLLLIAAPLSAAEKGHDDKFRMFPVEEKILQETNAQRARFGLPALKLDPALVESAREHAVWMCSTHNLSHTSKMVGENIALGQQSAKEALSDWMNSSGHRANILNIGYTRIGVAAYQIGENGEIYWCQQFLR
ncbi:MAG: CAP domain-containing protein [Planctomycetia bacterium]|nr:CAP domain-containing protein [Planctomycetia bacterium]